VVDPVLEKTLSELPDKITRNPNDLHAASIKHPCGLWMDCEQPSLCPKTFKYQRWSKPSLYRAIERQPLMCLNLVNEPRILNTVDCPISGALTFECKERRN